jgi:hypothetical protein
MIKRSYLRTVPFSYMILINYINDALRRILKSKLKSPLFSIVIVLMRFSLIYISPKSNIAYVPG